MPTSRVNIKPEIIKWARIRAGYNLESPALIKKFKKLPEWEKGEIKPTLKQIEEFAKTVHVPIGYLFGSKPPEEKLPIRDFRTFPDKKVIRPSPDLIDTLDICLLRMNWYREYALREQLRELNFIGSSDISRSPDKVAIEIAQTINYDIPSRKECKTKEEAFSFFRSRIEESRILVMVSAIVGNNTYRKLDPQEFRGFALADPYAPLIFVNGVDPPAARIFTLAHELAHLWIGKNGISNLEIKKPHLNHDVEIWCNKVAAELLVPREELKNIIKTISRKPPIKLLPHLTSYFKVSTLVILKRLLDIGVLSREEFEEEWGTEIKKFQKSSKGGGGDYYMNALSRAGRTFTRALISSTLEDNTLYLEAFNLLDISNTKQFKKLATKLDKKYESFIHP